LIEEKEAMFKIWLTTILILFCFALAVFSGATAKIVK